VIGGGNMGIEIHSSNPAIDEAVIDHIAEMMARDLLNSGIDLDDTLAVMFELRAREYSQRSISAVAARAVSVARRSKQ
jgi:hypothetical protein